MVRGGPLARPVLRGEALPGADDLLGALALSGAPPALFLLLLLLRVDGVDPALRGNVHLDLEETGGDREGYGAKVDVRLISRKLVELWNTSCASGRRHRPRTCCTF